jgi:hypothetical protein
MMRRLPQGLLRWSGAFRVFAKAAIERVNSSSGICLISSTDDSISSEIDAGRAMQRAWLALAASNLAVQPMMSLLVLQNIRDNAPEELASASDRQATDLLLHEFYDFTNRFGAGRPAALLRFGHAQPPTARVGRLPIDVSLQSFK